jgi:hypothetical protein
MKMVKSLLLGSAAGLVAVSAGQAADLPVKAKPVEYVKVCSLYGAGFYYMPGTDMCIKIGGYVRAEAAYHTNGSITWGPFNGNANVRTTNELVFRARGYITADAREQTAWGTARGYIAVGINTNDVGINTAANIFSANRAFVQWAGFTAGLTQSFFDFYSGPASSYWGIFPQSDTGDGGWLVFAYTAQLGNGLSATLSAEERRMTQIINADPFDVHQLGRNGFITTVFGGANTSIGSIGSLAPGGFQTGAQTDGIGSSATLGGVFPGVGAYGGFNAPDVVANVRYDQTWGSAQVMGALHKLNASSYGISSTGTANMATGHPGDEWGWVVGGGLRLNFPMIAQGDFFQTQVNYTEGALKYIFQTPNSNWGKADSSQEAYGVLSDAVYGSTSGNSSTHCVGCVGLQLTTAWNINAAFEHYWTPAFHSSLYGGYAEVKYNSTANNGLCNIENSNAASIGGNTAALFTNVVPGCNNNWNTWWIGSRTQWDVTKTFYMGVDVLYSKLESATINSSGTFSASSTATGTQGMAIAGSAVVAGRPNSVENVDNIAVRFRVHKDFLP